MRIGVIGLLALLLPAMAQAQYGKPEPLSPGLETPDPGGKPAPLGAEPAPRREAPSRLPDQGQGQGEGQGQGQAGRCAQTLANGCLGQQSACQVACPPQWSTNPNAPAFTPNDRAGCMGQCQQRYFACMRLYGCM